MHKVKYVNLYYRAPICFFYFTVSSMPNWTITSFHIMHYTSQTIYCYNVIIINSSNNCALPRNRESGEQMCSRAYISNGRRDAMFLWNSKPCIAVRLIPYENSSDMVLTVGICWKHIFCERHLKLSVYYDYYDFKHLMRTLYFVLLKCIF